MFTAISPANQWGWHEVFANKTTYLLELLLWQNSATGRNRTRHRQNKPKPFVPDFLKEKLPPSPIIKDAELKETWEIDLILKQARG